MTRLHIDIETRSTVNLTRTGVFVYAEDPATEILCVAWAIGDDPVQLWRPSTSTRPGDAIPFLLADALADPAVTLVAHNFSFERGVCTAEPGRRIGFPVDAMRPIERWDCTASRAACFGLPRTLEGAGAALGLAVTKDKEGHRLMLQMCKPRKPSKSDPGLWFDDEPRHARLGAYCVQDVEVERRIDAVLPPLSPVEHEIWATTEAMNETGVRVDADLLLAMSLFVDDAEQGINAGISAATDGAVPKISDHAALTRWLTAQGIDDAAENGVGKAALAAMLEDTSLEPDIRNVLVMRRDGGGSASKKYKAILARLSRDGRLRGALVYCGAASTRRWASRGAQLQNLPRGGSVKNVSAAIAALLAGATPAEVEDMFGPALVVAAELLRPIFCSDEGAWLARGDYSQIEARVIAWLAGAEWKLQAFRDFDNGTGPDLYRLAAAGIYRVPAESITSDQRQVGKVSELALGFQGGAGALQAMAKAYRLEVPKCPEMSIVEIDAYGRERVKVEKQRPAPVGTDEWIKAQWRTANPEVCQLWRDMENAAMTCMQAAPGQFVPVGTLGLGFKRNAVAMTLRLPSGGHLVYWTPRLREVMMPWGEKRLAVTYRSEDPVTKQWREFVGYGGLWTENAVQATARDIMAAALVKMRRLGMRPVLTVHDEGIGELLRSKYPTAREVADAVAAVMRDVDAWCAGLPVAADASAAVRYAKA